MAENVTVEAENKDSDIIGDNFYVLGVGLWTSFFLLFTAFSLYTFANWDFKYNLLPLTIFFGLMFLAMGTLISVQELPGTKFAGNFIVVFSTGALIGPLVPIFTPYAHLPLVFLWAGLTTILVTVVFWTTNPKMNLLYLLLFLSLSFGISGVRGLQTLGITETPTPLDFILCCLLLFYVFRKWVKGMKLPFTWDNTQKTQSLFYLDVLMPIVRNF